ncbi:hypothetical protein [Gallaecimonas xiamenensis]|uniref:Uncharacterized protein n=1 Tax=Gallaecimonas xiamenensis 3-C-1 TaxID=745411 RepID=K2ILL2_9GAMM|nr:hypothetical protein [Gallaecimonas xiamenensis]EKE71041.1 hypothetical protein B3C1_12829 [Gallaecimonas xiamenensis 3-C-1]
MRFHDPHHCRQCQCCRSQQQRQAVFSRNQHILLVLASGGAWLVPWTLKHLVLGLYLRLKGWRCTSCLTSADAFRA